MARKLPPILLPYLACYLLWALWDRLGPEALPPGPGAAAADALLATGLVWGLPALLLLLRGRGPWLAEPRRLFSPPFPWLPCVVLLCASAAFLHTLRLAALPAGLVVFFTPTLLLLSVCAGVYEELFFRGFLFNRLAPALGLWPAALLDGALFALYHFPGLIFGRGWGELFSLRGLFLAVMGALFCLILARWKHLALPMIVHTFWNVLSYWFGLFG